MLTLARQNISMAKNDPEPRIPRIPAEQRTDEMLDIIALFAGPGRINVDNNHVLTTFVNHPELARHFLTFNRYLLLSSTLPVRLRQIAIMRVAWIKRATYVWSSHLRTSLRNGLTGEEFEPVKQGESSPYWNEQERVILRATDQAMKNFDVDDVTWKALATFLEQRQIMDFLFTVGAYALLGMVCNALRIEREDALLELAEKFGAP
jgi:alkylhydroperoxidase family enzyme